MTGFFAELDARIRGYSPPPIPGPDTGPPDTSDTEEGLEDSARSGGLAAAAVAAGVLIGAALSSAIGSALDMSSAQSRLAAQLGDQNMIGAERAGKVAANLYAGAWGSSLGEVSDAVSMVIRSGAVAADATDEQIQGVTASVLDLAAAFDVDTVQATAALSAMVRNNLVPNAEAGLDVITRLYQTLGPGAEDVLDTFEEYSSQFAKVGIDAQIAGGLIAQMMEGGARSTDIAADAIKEFSIRSIDGSKTTIEAYSAIGVNADEMRRRIAAGGPDAQVAMSQVVAALQGVEDPAVRAEAAVGLFGTQAEDLGNALFAMDPENAVATLGDVEGAATRMGTTLNDNATVKITEFQRGLEVGVAGIINENVIPAVEGFLTAMDGFLSIPGVPDVLGFIFSAGAGIAITLGTIAAVTRAWTIAQAAFNIVMGLSPLTIVIVTLAALAG
jgi:phage-related minor tail protein